MSQSEGACLVVGAGDGLGGAIAAAFAAEGLEVCVTRRPRHADQLEALADKIRADGGRAHAFPLDAREESEVVALVDRIERDIGAARSRRLQHRRQCALSADRDDDAGLLEGLGDGGARRAS